MSTETEERKISFRVTKDQEVEGVYCVSCPEMWYVSHTTDPERIMKDLVKEWVSFNMGEELSDIPEKI